MDKQGLVLNGIGKQFYGITVLSDIDFEILPGEIHGLLGENGAGKSTLMKIINGALTPTTGDIYIDGEKMSFDSPHAAANHGIRMVYQELDLFPHLTVAENICQGNIPKNKAGMVDWKEMERVSKELLKLIKVDINVNERMDRLSIAQQQIAAIARALNGNCKFILLDEPTSALPKKDVENLFAIVRNLKKEGISVVFISHKLDEMMDITDRITILNNGKKVATVQTSDINEELLAEMVVGKTIKNKYPKVRYEKGETLLRFEHITLKNHLNDISFELKRGEVLGIVGLLGAGKTEIAKALFGVYGKGNDKLTGNIWFNSLASLKHIRRGVFLDLKKEKAINQKLIEKLQVKCESMKQKVTNLSGGNQQKVVIAKWFASKARIIVLDEPTRGIDIGAKVEVYKLINEMVEAGIGVILLSSEVPEVFGMADRILVLKDGQITGEYGMDEINKINETDLQRLVM